MSFQLDLRGVRGSQRESNPRFQDHNLACFRYTMTTVPVPREGIEPPWPSATGLQPVHHP